MIKLEKVLAVQSYSGKTQKRMKQFIKTSLTGLNCNVVNHNGNIYITKGDAVLYPCIVAHMDTVHPIVEDLTVIKMGDNLTGFNRAKMTQTGIGGDDKVGIYIALKALEVFDNIKVAFFHDEEIGCHGSYDADLDFFDDVSFVLQADRRGNKDFIVDAGGIELSSKEFQDAILPTLKSYGYHFENGMMTDVMALKEIGLNVCCANISCGYYNPHCSNEFVNIQDVENCMQMMFDLIEQFGSMQFKHVFVDEWQHLNNGKIDYNANDFWKNYDNKQEQYCTDCFRGIAVKDGLCEGCIGYYKKYYEIDF